MARIAYFVHGRGKGHAVRTAAVLDALGPRDDVHLYCASGAMEVLHGYPGAQEVLAYAPGRGMARSFAVRFRTDRMRFRRLRPSLVVSDGDAPSVHAAWSLGIPVLAAGHGLIFRHTRLPPELSELRRLREVVNAGSSSWPAQRRVAVHFAPVEPATPGTTVARPDLRVGAPPRRRREDFLLAYFRDDDGIEVVAHLAARGHRVVLFGNPRVAPRGVEVHAPDVHEFNAALQSCRAVVASAGNQLPAECALLGVPMLALHRQADAEHTMNAQLIENAGIGIASAFEAYDLPIARRFEHDMDRDRAFLARRTRAMPPASKVIPNQIAAMCGIDWSASRRSGPTDHDSISA